MSDRDPLMTLGLAETMRLRVEDRSRSAQGEAVPQGSCFNVAKVSELCATMSFGFIRVLRID